MNADLIHADRLQEPKTPPTEAQRRLIQPSERFFRLNFPALHDTPKDYTRLIDEIAAGIGCKAQLVTTGAQMGDELGTRFIVSGGEVLELGPQIDADEPSDEEYPF